jgi:hypothetical protein
VTGSAGYSLDENVWEAIQVELASFAADANRMRRTR